MKIIPLVLMGITFGASCDLFSQQHTSPEDRLQQLASPALKQSKHIVIKPIELKDSSGLVYLGGLIPKAQIQKYLSQMQNDLGDEFAQYRQNQAARDHSLFHLTLVNPYEYQTIDKQAFDTDKPIKVMLQGLGKASKDGKTTYFVVADSSDGQFLRQQLLLKPKDFHVTLGFNPSDIYDVRKGVDTLIVK